MRNYKLIATGGAIVALGAVGFSVPVTGPAPEAAPAPAEAVETPAAPANVTAPVTFASAPAGAAPAPAPEPAPEPARAPALETLTGSASYYADMFEGRTTASGVPFRQAEMWAAHRTLPFGTRLRVTNLKNGTEVEVEVVDRGPYAHGRVLDLSKAAARKLDFVRAGHTQVKIEVVARP